MLTIRFLHVSIFRGGLGDLPIVCGCRFVGGGVGGCVLGRMGFPLELLSEQVSVGFCSLQMFFRDAAPCVIAH